MRTRAKGTSRAAVLAAGFVALGVTAIPSNAFGDITDGRGGILSGNQVNAPISAPVDVSGNGAAVLGKSSATSRGGAKVHKRGDGGQRTSGRHGVASGNQVNAPISLPVNVCGNAVAVLGHADAGCRGGAKVKDGGGGGQVTDGTGGVIAGNQVNAPISIPVNVCGNAVAIAGHAVAGCEGGAKVKNGGHTGSGQVTSGMFGVGSGNQANLPISIPVDVCGNAVGNAAAACEGGASVRNGGHRTGSQTTRGDFGVLAGNQANAPISIPLTVCGNAAALVGQAGAFCEGGAHVRSSSGGGRHTSGTGGVLAGNQGNTPVTAPADVCGNATAVVGLASALCQDGPGDGYQPYHRTTGAALPSTAESSHGAALPAVASSAPGDLPESHILPAIARLPKPSGTPAANDRHMTGGLPVTDALAKVGGLPQTGGLPKLNGVMGANDRHTTGGLPVTDALPKVPSTGKPSKALLGSVPDAGSRQSVTTPLPAGAVKGGDVLSPLAGAGAGAGAPRAVSLLDTRNIRGDAAQRHRLPALLPGVQRTQEMPGVPGGQVLPSSPVAPSLRAAGTDLPGTGVLKPPSKPGEIVPVKGEIGPVKRVSAEQAITPKREPGSTWTFGAAGVLAAVAGALAMIRRVRPGRR